MHSYFFEGKLNGVITLTEVESNHAIKVMRTKENDLVRIINGKGGVATGRISLAHPKKCEVTIIDAKQSPKPAKEITIAIAPTKSNDRIEFFIEKATEIGVTVIIPLICKNSERDKIKLERWRKVALSATKQSQRTWMPVIKEPIKVKSLVESENLPVTKLIAYCEDLPEKSIKEFSDNKDVLVLIGPEGDFTEDEVLYAEKANFTRVNLGENRLRTETAGIVAVTVLN